MQNPFVKQLSSLDDYFGDLGEHSTNLECLKLLCLDVYNCFDCSNYLYIQLKTYHKLKSPFLHSTNN